MMNYFPDLPDTTALAKLSGRAAHIPKGVPLFFDGVRAFADSPDFEQWLPLPATRLGLFEFVDGLAVSSQTLG